MNIWVQNKSSVMTDDQVGKLIPAMHQFALDVRAAWGTAMPNFHFGADPVKPEIWWQMLFLDASDVAGALGDHDYTPGGMPVLNIFAGDAIKYGYSVSVVATHELAEALMDPYVRRCEQTGEKQFHALELCDPCEADKFGYQVTTYNGNYLVSDFICPDWFYPEMKGKAGAKFDFKGHCTAPLQVLSGGYAYIWDPVNEWHGLNDKGEKVEEEDEKNRWKIRRSK